MAPAPALADRRRGMSPLHESGVRCSVVLAAWASEPARATWSESCGSSFGNTFRQPGGPILPNLSFASFRRMGKTAFCT
jgi:hypothetical protein